MQASLVIRRGLVWTVVVLAVLMVLIAGLGAALNAGYFRASLIRFFEVRWGRQINIGGKLDAHLFSTHPRVDAEHVILGNPPWMPRGLTAEIGKISLLIETPRLGQPLVIERLEMDAATLHLVRDPEGRANWQWTDPKQGAGTSLPMIRSLTVSGAHVLLDDGRRHLQFDGMVSAGPANAKEGLQALRIEGSGQLNGKAASLAITGDPLATASLEKPYHFTFTERSGGSRLTAHGFLPQPFQLDVLDASFEVAGEDLKELYFLTGLTLVNTGAYRLSGRLAFRGPHTKFTELAATSGRSDVHGDLSVDSSAARPKLDADLHSEMLRMSDIGPRTAGRTAEADAGPPLLLSTASLSVQAVRASEGVYKYRARRVVVGRVSLQAVAANMRIDHGILTVTPLVAEVFGGKLSADIRLDASKEDVPPAEVDLKLSNAQLAQIAGKDPSRPSADGAVGVRVTVAGRGISIHQVAATANGAVRAMLPHGTIRTSLAELTGIDLRGLGLLLTKNGDETAIRCGVATFKAQQGTLIAEHIVVDTDPVLITGDGTIHLDSEALDLVLRGNPKSLRLFRLRAPVLVRGTLTRPAIEIQPHHLKLIDPGRAKDIDCAALLAGAKD